MKRTRTFIIAWLLAFAALFVSGGIYEFWTLTNTIPNDTISHVMTAEALNHPWIPVAFVVFFVGLWPWFWSTCVLHWWSNNKHKFWWNKAKIVDDDLTPR